MKSSTKCIWPVGATRFALAAVLLSVGLVGSACEAMDDFDSRLACQDYCAKKFDCENHDPTGDESDGCVAACRNSIEDNCGNENQGAANDKLEECVDQGCLEFWGCMVFDAAPECFGFVSH